MLNEVELGRLKTVKELAGLRPMFKDLQQIPWLVETVERLQSECNRLTVELNATRQMLYTMTRKDNND
jgi:hypothetical protein